MTEEQIERYNTWKSDPDTREFLLLTLLRAPQNITSEGVEKAALNAAKHDGFHLFHKRLITLDAGTDEADPTDAADAMPDLTGIAAGSLGINPMGL